jgi:hypothetical protein
LKIIAIAAAGLAATAIATANPVHAATNPQVHPATGYALQPPPQSDPRGEVQELLRQITELDDNWNGLTPAQRNQRIAGLQQQVTRVQNDVNALPPDQRPEVQGMLGVAVIKLADILRKEQTPPTSPCIFPACLPGL